MDANTFLSARENFIQGLSRISHFWGFSKAMGAIYGSIYLSPTPLCLDDLVQQVGVSKGAVSTNIHQLERFGMVHKHVVVGDRKDYFSAETNFWKIIKGILQEREKSEFDAALKSITHSLEILEKIPTDENQELCDFYQYRMENMQKFFKTIDNIVATALALEELRESSIGRMFSKIEDI